MGKLEEIYRDGFDGSEDMVDLQLELVDSTSSFLVINASFSVLKTMCAWLTTLTLTVSDSKMLIRLRTFVQGIVVTVDDDIRNNVQILNGHVSRQVRSILNSLSEAC